MSALALGGSWRLGGGAHIGGGSWYCGPRPDIVRRHSRASSTKRGVATCAEEALRVRKRGWRRRVVCTALVSRSVAQGRGIARMVYAYAASRRIRCCLASGRSGRGRSHDLGRAVHKRRVRAAAATTAASASPSQSHQHVAHGYSSDHGSRIPAYRLAGVSRRAPGKLSNRFRSGDLRLLGPAAPKVSQAPSWLQVTAWRAQTSGEDTTIDCFGAAALWCTCTASAPASGCLQRIQAARCAARRSPHGLRS